MPAKTQRTKRATPASPEDTASTRSNGKRLQRREPQDGWSWSKHDYNTKAITKQTLEWAWAKLVEHLWSESDKFSKDEMLSLSSFQRKLTTRLSMVIDKNSGFLGWEWERTGNSSPLNSLEGPSGNKTWECLRRGYPLLKHKRASNDLTQLMLRICLAKPLFPNQRGEWQPSHYNNYPKL